MKNRDVIEAFRATLRDLPLPDQEDRLQLFQEKLDGLDSGAPDAGQEQPGGGDGQGEPCMSREQAPDGGRQADRSHSPREGSAFPVRMITAALAAVSLAEAIAIGVFAICRSRGEKP